MVLGGHEWKKYLSPGQSGGPTNLLTNISMAKNVYHCVFNTYLNGICNSYAKKNDLNCLKVC